MEGSDYPQRTMSRPALHLTRRSIASTCPVGDCINSLKPSGGTVTRSQVRYPTSLRDGLDVLQWLAGIVSSVGLVARATNSTVLQRFGHPHLILSIFTPRGA